MSKLNANEILTQQKYALLRYIYSYQKYTSLDTVRHLTRFSSHKKNPAPVTGGNAPNSKGNYFASAAMF